MAQRFRMPRRPEGMDGLLAIATWTELVALGRHTSAAGQAAMILAARIDTSEDNGTALAACSRQWSKMLAEAKDNVAVVDSPLDSMRDDLASRRQA